jgi:hypothetical protein
MPAIVTVLHRHVWHATPQKRLLDCARSKLWRNPNQNKETVLARITHPTEEATHVLQVPQGRQTRGRCQRRAGSECVAGRATVSLTVNGKSVSAEIDARTLLVQLLREQLRLTGTARRLRHQPVRRLCGARRRPRRQSCTMLAASCEGAKVTTIEGSPRAPSCTRCRRLPPASRSCSAATARPA